MSERASWTDDDWNALFHERAGIVEFDGGLSRAQAEAIARGEVKRMRREAEAASETTKAA